jgi:hypothetical protein
MSLRNVFAYQPVQGYCAIVSPPCTHITYSSLGKTRGSEDGIETDNHERNLLA